jgi:hypothetical protein
MRKEVDPWRILDGSLIAEIRKQVREILKSAEISKVLEAPKAETKKPKSEPVYERPWIGGDYVGR